jgi:hypothetical protein
MYASMEFRDGSVSLTLRPHPNGNGDGDESGGDGDSARAACVACGGPGEGDGECSVGTCLLCEDEAQCDVDRGTKSAEGRAASDQSDCRVETSYLLSSCGPLERTALHQHVDRQDRTRLFPRVIKIQCVCRHASIV